MERHALPEVEEKLRSVLGHFPAFRQVSLCHQVGIDVGKTTQDVRRDLELQDLIDLRGIEGSYFTDPRPAAGERGLMARSACLPRSSPGHEVPGRQGPCRRHQAQDRAPFKLGPGKLGCAQPE